jgi:hypothetical protein
MKSISNSQSLGRVDVYARDILPYYQKIATEHSVKLQKYGVFRALEIITTLAPSLVIVISRFTRDLSGLCEGALLANVSGHRIVIAILGNVRDTSPPELSILSESDIQVVQSGGADLVNAICRAVIDIPKIRIRNRLPTLIRTADG